LLGGKKRCSKCLYEFKEKLGGLNLERKEWKEKAIFGRESKRSFGTTRPFRGRFDWAGR